MRPGLILVSALLLTSALPADAQQPVTLQFSGGRVTLLARNAPVRTILAEWSRLGGATVVNGERVAGPPVTLELTNVPERQALDVILRGVAGYMLAPRRTGSAGVSAFDRIMILPTSAAPRNPPPAAAAARPGVPRPIVMPPRPPQPALDEPVEVEVEDTAESDEVESPAVNAPPTPRVPSMIRPLPGAQPTQDEDNAENTGTSSGTAVTSTPSNPFGRPVGSSATPGVISPVPRPQQQGPANRVQ